MERWVVASRLSSTLFLSPLVLTRSAARSRPGGVVRRERRHATRREPVQRFGPRVHDRGTKTATFDADLPHSRQSILDRLRSDDRNREVADLRLGASKELDESIDVVWRYGECFDGCEVTQNEPRAIREIMREHLELRSIDLVAGRRAFEAKCCAIREVLGCPRHRRLPCSVPGVLA